MVIAGYFLAVLMGVVLGLIGGGGSILTVPILVYVFQLPADHATAYSLFIVGVGSLLAVIDYYRRGLVDIKTGMIFAVPAFVGVYCVRRYLMPVIPLEIPISESFTIAKDTLILSTFAVVMLVSSIPMIKRNTHSVKAEKKNPSFLVVMLEGLFVGALTGFVGAGGGFVIIPVLVLLAGLDMKVAVGTSLLVITIKSLIGFVGDVQSLAGIDWRLLMTFTAFAVVGIIVGTRLSKRVEGPALEPVFGWFVLAMGAVMLVKEVVL